MKDKNGNKFKWNEFNTTFLQYIEENNDKICSISKKENEAALIVKVNDGGYFLSRYYDNDGYIGMDTNDHLFNSVKNCLEYLRKIRIDHAVDYNYKYLVRKLIAELYLNGYIKTEDII